MIKLIVRRLKHGRMQCTALTTLLQQFRQLKFQTETHLQHQLNDIYGMLKEFPERDDGLTKRDFLECHHLPLVFTLYPRHAAEADVKINRYGHQHKNT